ncbi:unnamed protein product [Rotaria socialis]|uniref:Uncharacterized protein n=1 Tax=Rotaria socialis TaxID=392032 RepID=A0A817XWP5_9BILA|nr:unnamed protein product [Rotaria socialis]CAF3600060.1 unnamed protein product [Rotaria socialis]CAF4461129.1 unnamed protein product [Rotaria socialis]CAF4530334.1 unnamed protein product [Rotaria socialis]CAF4619986.1 unnamed protein product [Rotaria socialis]
MDQAAFSGVLGLVDRLPAADKRRLAAFDSNTERYMFLSGHANSTELECLRKVRANSHLYEQAFMDHYGSGDNVCCKMG